MNSWRIPTGCGQTSAWAAAKMFALFVYLTTAKVDDENGSKWRFYTVKSNEHNENVFT